MAKYVTGKVVLQHTAFIRFLLAHPFAGIIMLPFIRLMPRGWLVTTTVIADD